MAGRVFDEIRMALNRCKEGLCESRVQRTLDDLCRMDGWVNVWKPLLFSYRTLSPLGLLPLVNLSKTICTQQGKGFAYDHWPQSVFY